MVYLLGLTIPHWETQLFLAFLQVLSLLVVFLQDLKVLRQDCLQVMAASPVLVLAETTLLLVPDWVTTTTTDDAAAEADDPEVIGLEKLGVLDWDFEEVALPAAGEVPAAAFDEPAADPATDEAATAFDELAAAAFDEPATDPATDEATAAFDEPATDPATDEAAADGATDKAAADGATEEAAADGRTEEAAIDGATEEAAKEDGATEDGATEEPAGVSDKLMFVVITNVPVMEEWKRHLYG